MKIQLAVLSALAACCVAERKLDLSADIPADSKLGNSLLSKARRVNQEEPDYTWMTSYSIRFNSCHTIHNFANADAEGQEEEGASPLQNQHLVKFHLCPSDSECEKCKYGGEYVVNMREFLEVYLETKQQLEEAQCEAVADTCNCDYYNGDDEACAAQCYTEAGLDFCVEDENGFEVNEFLECAEAEFSNNAYYASTYFIGPVCDSTGSAIYMDLFKDMSCSMEADSGAYQKYNYGSSLPYASKSIVESGCISCQEVDENAYYNQNNNYYQQADPIELCTELYVGSAKCENKMNKNYPDVGSCEYINQIIPALEKVYQKGGSGGNSAVILAWIFFITTLVASAGLYHFYVIAKRKINLSGNSGVQMSGGIL